MNMRSRRIFNACLRKQLYKSEADAEDALAALLPRVAPARRTLYRTYKCPFCGSYHVGRRFRVRSPT